MLHAQKNSIELMNVHVYECGCIHSLLLQYRITCMHVTTQYIGVLSLQPKPLF